MAESLADRAESVETLLSRAAFDARALAYLHLVGDEPRDRPPVVGIADKFWCNLHVELAKLELGRRGEATAPLDMGIVDGALAHMDAHRDCSDFQFQALIRIRLQHWDSPLLTDELRARMEQTLFGFMYALSDPGCEQACYLSENHQILYATAELLAGQTYPRATFLATNRLGHWHYQRGRERVRQWLNWRLRFGFGEWLSHHYLDEDLLALVNLADFAHDPVIVSRAKAVAQLALMQVALHSQRGDMGATAGRLYQGSILNADSQGVGPVSWLLWGLGRCDRALSLTAIAMVGSSLDWSRPAGLVAHDQPDEAVVLERASLSVAEAAEWGVQPDRLTDMPFFAGSGQLRFPQTVATARAYIPRKHGNVDWGLQLAFDHFAQAAAKGEAVVDDQGPGVLSRVNVHTFRTPDGMLSAAVDYRKGKPGYQQHIWQATLSRRARVFTTAPSPVAEGRPGHWAGNAILPRVLAHRNVLLALYRIESQPIFGMQPLPSTPATHAYFPRWAFDEVVERDGWVIGRAGEGYVALRSLAATRWCEPDEAVLRAVRSSPVDERVRDVPAVGVDATPEPCGAYELWADGRENAWLCELGSRAMSGSFDAFVEAIAAAAVEGDVSALSYRSPSLGAITAGWDQPLAVNGEVLDMAGPLRFDSPYLQAEFGATSYAVNVDRQTYDLTPLADPWF